MSNLSNPIATEHDSTTSSDGTQPLVGADSSHEIQPLAHPEHALGAPRERRYEQHELSALFPRMESDAFARLVESVQHQGLLEPITLADGKILDGFHRDEACYVAGVEPRYEALASNKDQLDYVFGKNFDRRQMTVSQASLVAAKAATLARGRPTQTSRINADKVDLKKISRSNGDTENKMNKNVHLIAEVVESGLEARQTENERSNVGGDSDPLTRNAEFDSVIGLSNAQAAQLAGVSRQSIVIAKRLLNGGNDNLLNAVMQHGMSNGHALSLSKLPVDDQIEAIHAFVEGKQEGEKRVKRKATEKKAVEKSRKENAGIDVTCVVPGESPLLTVSRVLNGFDWAINFFKEEVPNEGLQHRYDKLLARAKALIDNDQNVKKVRLVF